MSDIHLHQVDLRLVTKYRVMAEFPEVSGTPSLLFDERPPVGDGQGPNAAMVLGAAIGDCLSATLMNCLTRAHVELQALTATVVTRVARNHAGRFRISGIEVELCPTVPAGERAGLERLPGHLPRLLHGYGERPRGHPGERVVRAAPAQVMHGASWPTMSKFNRGKKSPSNPDWSDSRRQEWLSGR